MTAPAPPSAASGTIRKLDARLINQIAAGEVIVRPASALKELIENSLDAGATRIEIAVEADARAFTIRDDGCGIAPDEAPLALERYATSKISQLDDLMRITTRGFRGEALAAISSVARFELMTRREGDDAGTIVRAEGGGPLRVESAGLPAGTTIRVSDLFFNTPARLKFMRGPVQEWGHMLREIQRQALARPEVAFVIRWRGQPYLTLPAAQTLRERLGAILPGGAASDLYEIDATLHEVRAWGCVTGPRTTRRDRRNQYFFANGRPITARTLTFALQEAYKGLIMTQQYPLCAIFLELPGEMLDVNVHPAKEEVRFLNEPLAAGVIHRAALEALRKAELVPAFEMPRTPGSQWAQKGPIKAETPEVPYTPPPDFFKPSAALAAAFGMATPAAEAQGELELGVAAPPPLSASAAPAQAPPPSPAPPRAEYLDPAAIEEITLIERLRAEGTAPRVLAQISETYILADAPGLGLLLVDQHAAHEKLLYIRFRKRAEGLGVQELLVPFTYEASPAERAVLEGLAPALGDAGFEIEHFGGSTFVIQSVPSAFEKLNLQRFLRDLIDETGDGNLARELDRARHRIGAMAACKAAVKAGDPMTVAQMQALLDQVIAESEAMRCPHGRPTMLLLGREQLDRQFGRT